MRTYTAVITGEAEAARVAVELTHRSQWFASEPMPDDQWEITVKQENDAMLKLVAAAPGTPETNPEEYARRVRAGMGIFYYGRRP